MRDRLTEWLESAKDRIQKRTGLSINSIGWIVILSIFYVAVILFLRICFLLAPHSNTLEGIKTLISLISTLATAIAGILVFWNVQIARRNARQGAEKLITDRFSKAVEQLGSDKMEVRLGGIYS